VAGVAVAAHVLSYVVQQCPELEKLAILRLKTVQGDGRVEQFERQLGDLARMSLGPSGPEAQ